MKDGRGSMKRKWIIGFSLLLALVLAGCEMAPEIQMSKLTKRKEDYQVAKFKPPAYVVKKLKPRIVVLPFADTSGYTQCRLGPMATEITQNVIASAGPYQVVERTRAKAIAKELGFQETHGISMEELEKKYFALGKNINFAVLGTVTYAEPVVSPGNVGAKVKLYVRILDLNKGSVVQSFSVEGQDIEGSAPNLCVVFQKALEDAIKCPLLQRLRDAVPLYGYVKEMRTYFMDGKTAKVLFVNLGSQDGLKPGDKVTIVKIERFVDPVTRKVSNRYIEVGEGTVSKTGLMPSEAIVLVDDPYVAKQVKVGYLVKVTSKAVVAECAGKHFLQGLEAIIRQMGQSQ